MAHAMGYGLPPASRADLCHESLRQEIKTLLKGVPERCHSGTERCEEEQSKSRILVGRRGDLLGMTTRALTDDEPRFRR